MLGWTYLMDVWYGSSESSGKSMERASELAQKALALGVTRDYAHSLLANIYLMTRQHEEAFAENKRAVALNPNGADAHAHLAVTLHCVGRQEEAIATLRLAIRLNPMPPNWYLTSLARAYCRVGQYEQAIAALQKALKRNPDDFMPRIGVATSYSMGGRMEEARAEAAEVLRINPRFSLEYFAKTIPYKNHADTELTIDALRKTGLK